MTPAINYSARHQSIRLSILLAGLCLVIIYGDWAWRWDRLIYDTESSLITQKADNDLVIIAIDEASLHSIGRWPWPRDIHATLIDKLTQYQARAIIFDVILSEPGGNNQHDQLLAQAIKKNGKVVLPVLLEQTRLGGQLLETLPLPAFTQTAADIGHVHVELDADGIVRSTYLYEGLGNARWPHIALAAANLINETGDAYRKLEMHSPNDINNAWTWKRKHHYLIPFIGPPGSFNTTSYEDVLNDHVLPEMLKDKIVLIGVTAAGLGDSLPTPVSGLARSMPGIEINANLYQAIKSGSLINTATPALHYFIAVVLVILPVLLFPHLTPRISLILIISEIIMVFFLTLLSLHLFHFWIPPGAILISLVLAYPLWAWRRLEFTVQYLNTELKTLTKEADDIEQFVSPAGILSFEFLQNLVPVSGITIFGENNEFITGFGKVCQKRQPAASESGWTAIGDNFFCRRILIEKIIHTICVCQNEAIEPNEQQTKIIKTYARKLILYKPELATSSVEIIESRIRDIQSTTDKLVYLRQFLKDSLEQMTDGVIVTDSLGTVTLINQQANRQINPNAHSTLLHQPIQPVLETLSIASGETWDSIISSLLSNKQYNNLQIRTARNTDHIVNISPLYKPDHSVAGFILNISDITKIKDAQRKRNEMLSFLSHDLRSPLVSVLAMLEQNKPANKDNELYRRIETNINHTIQLAEDFIHLSRAESDDNIAFSVINLSDVIANAVDTVWDSASKKHISITQAINNDGWVSGNGSMLERVMINLLTNAIQYSNDGSQIRITLNKSDSTIICCVEDNGPGIKQEDIPYLFDRFTRMDKHNNRQAGIGLGLAFVHAAIERHHGFITVNSKPGQGSSFCIFMPGESTE
ncbi:MAG: CHASE2 domain-containing protein [Gammaproteobacteria bacterium]|nr:CHASE2 domain-containing protein [Gammaproteobacteria bacterium]